MKVRFDLGPLRTTVEVVVDPELLLIDCVAETDFEQRDPGQTALVRIKSTIRAMYIIAHEAVHAASLILEYLEIDSEPNHHELMAYIVDYICERVERKLLEEQG